MNWECCTPHDDRSLRQKLVDPKIKSSSESEQVETKQAPLSIKIINALGLKEYILQKFVFRKQQSKYFFTAVSNQHSNQDMKVNVEDKDQKCEDMMYDEKESLKKYQMKRVYNKQQQLVIPEYTITAVILEKQNLNVPVVLLKNTNHSKYSPKLTIIYSHGNSSDILDAFDFFAKLVKFQPVNVVIYDFTGYGISSIKTTTQKTICEDLDLIVNWLNVPKEQIVLWGFSLGTYPTVNIGARYKFGGIILQSPIASACYFLQNQELKEKNIEKNTQKKGAYSYDKDSLDNLSHIGLIRSPIIIIHSSQDEIIPISHARKLYDIIRMQKKSDKYLLIEVSKLNHNQMHHYFCSDTDNPLKCVLSQFLENIKCRLFLQRQIQIKAKNNIKSISKNPHTNISSIQESIVQNQEDTVNMIPNMKNKPSKSTQKQWTKDKLQPDDKNKVFISLESNIPQFEQYKNYEHEWEWEIENQKQLQVINQSNGSNLSTISARTHDYINLSAKNHKSYFNMDQFTNTNTYDKDKNGNVKERENKKNMTLSVPISKKI